MNDQATGARFTAAAAGVGRLSDGASLAVWERVFAEETAEPLLDYVLNSGEFGRVALVSSFGTDSAVLLHMIAGVAPSTPVLFLDTGQLFPETLVYRDTLVDRLGLDKVQTLRPDAFDLRQTDPVGRLHMTLPDTCCHIRKTVPLARALAGYDTWLTGRKRYQTRERTGLNRFERDAGGRIKVNPLADWQPGDIDAYLKAHDLPAHPLVARNYKSVGCAPCTTPVADGEDPRAGRWRGSAKSECGIHLLNGQWVRSGR